MSLLHFYSEFNIKRKIDNKLKVKVISGDASNLGPLRITKSCIILGSYGFECKFIVCKNLLYSVILGVDFAQSFMIGVALNSQDQLYLHQNLKPLTYLIQANPKENSAIYSTDYNKIRFITESNIL